MNISLIAITAVSSFLLVFSILDIDFNKNKRDLSEEKELKTSKKKKNNIKKIGFEYFEDLKTEDYFKEPKESKESIQAEDLDHFVIIENEFS